MAKIAQLVAGDYNVLDNIPVINQDLSASGFTPVANTYYRHIGATTDTFTQGVIYLYDTSYHKLGESGGGTTLNKYTYKVDLMNTSYQIQDRIKRIADKATKYSMYAECGVVFTDSYSTSLTGYLLFGGYNYACYTGVLGDITSSNKITASVLLLNEGVGVSKTAGVIRNNAVATISNWRRIDITIEYYNDTEIT